VRTSLTVRPYAPADLDALIALFRGSVRTVARRDYTDDQVIAWAPDEIDREAWAVRRASRPTWVAAIDETPAGFIDLESDGHIDMLYVHPGHQGKGIASTLLETVENAARARSVGRLYTEASLTARPFFERRGFRMLGPRTLTRGGVDLVNFRMEKILS
jgi:putative acetyltransferase